MHTMHSVYGVANTSVYGVAHRCMVYRPISRRFISTEVDDLCDLSNIRPHAIQMNANDSGKDVILTELIKTSKHLINWEDVEDKQAVQPEHEQTDECQRKKKTLQAEQQSIFYDGLTEQLKLK